MAGNSPSTATAGPVEVRALTGAALADALPALACLRIEVFRAWPYLYDGTLAYEEAHLAHFARTRGAVIVAAIHHGGIVGVATASPLAGQPPNLTAPFLDHGADVPRIFYFGESVLLPAYRGRGLGHAFFDHREAHARSLGGFTHAAFCAVVRPSDHPDRSADYVPLDAFWRKRGYAPIPGLVGTIAWTDIGTGEPTAKPMQVWMRALT